MEQLALLIWQVNVLTTTSTIVRDTISQCWMDQNKSDSSCLIRNYKLIMIYRMLLLWNSWGTIYFVDSQTKTWNRTGSGASNTIQHALSTPPVYRTTLSRPHSQARFRMGLETEKHRFLRLCLRLPECPRSSFLLPVLLKGTWLLA